MAVKAVIDDPEFIVAMAKAMMKKKPGGCRGLVRESSF